MTMTPHPATPHPATPTRRDHMVAIIERHDEHDPTIEVARRFVEGGGDATVVVLVTDRLRDAIDGYAEGARLRRADAEEYTLASLAHRYQRYVGQPVEATVAHEHPKRIDVTQYVRPGTTAIAVHSGVMGGRAIRRLASKTGLSVVVTPRRAA